MIMYWGEKKKNQCVAGTEFSIYLIFSALVFQSGGKNMFVRK